MLIYKTYKCWFWRIWQLRVIERERERELLINFSLTQFSRLKLFQSSMFLHFLMFGADVVEYKLGNNFSTVTQVALQGQLFLSLAPRYVL